MVSSPEPRRRTAHLKPKPNPRPSPAPTLRTGLRADRPMPLGLPEPRWRPVYQGIDAAELATDRPRPLVVHVLRLHAHAPGLVPMLTPGNGPDPLETDGQTTRAFLEAHGLAVAINAHFFDPCCDHRPGQPKDLVGLAIAQGRLVSPHDPADSPDGAQPDVLLLWLGQAPEAPIGQDLGTPDPPAWSARLVPAAPPVETLEHARWLQGVWCALAGRAVLLDGRPIVGQDAFSTTRHPRTLVGLGPAGRWLDLVVIDGRQPGVSTGASLGEAAEILLALGDRDALNLDGGGSATMVLRDPDGASQLVNSPSGRAERIVGSNLGFVARPLEPVPADPQ
ncbi:MAG: hypothetical protein KatS3mg103_0673 [Phycisphaerales bacterium]|nr:MAG: hypothetical protein KatS3mg103_0673 [Phycisphaerales bacterium]